MKRYFMSYVLSVFILFCGILMHSKDWHYELSFNRTEEKTGLTALVEKIPYLNASLLLYQIYHSWHRSTDNLPQEMLENQPGTQQGGIHAGYDSLDLHEYFHECPAYNQKNPFRDATQYQEQEEIQVTFASQQNSFFEAIEASEQLRETYQEYGVGDVRHLEKRAAACRDIQEDGFRYTTKMYQLSPTSIQMLKRAGYESAQYRACYGNQLQQALHRECVHILERTVALSPGSMLYDYQNALLDLTDSAREYNQAGLTTNALNIVNFCFTFLDYGKAVVEGAVLGLTCVATDIAEHPIQATLCVVAGEYVLAYQLSRLACNVAEIGVLALINRKKSAQKLHDYLEPLNQFIAAVENKEISMRDAVKGTTAFAVGWKAQSKMLGGIHKICKTARLKAIQFARNNPVLSPGHYMRTPEGFVVKAMHRVSHGGLQNKGGGKSKNCPASCVGQYKNLENALKTEQYTSIIKCTKHGLERLMERFTSEEVRKIINNPDLIKIQRDGAKVLIKRDGNKYGFIAINQKTSEVVTGVNNLNINDLEKLGKNYGWN